VGHHLASGFMTRITFIVSRDHLDLVPALARENRQSDVEIIVDRRRSERRIHSQPTLFSDRRRSARRSRSSGREIGLIGVAVLIASTES
jgi:hypothetical protein